MLIFDRIIHSYNLFRSFHFTVPGYPNQNKKRTVKRQIVPQCKDIIHCGVNRTRGGGGEKIFPNVHGLRPNLKWFKLSYQNEKGFGFSSTLTINIYCRTLHSMILNCVHILLTAVFANTVLS